MAATYLSVYTLPAARPSYMYAYVIRMRDAPVRRETLRGIQLRRPLMRESTERTTLWRVDKRYGSLQCNVHPFDASSGRDAIREISCRDSPPANQTKPIPANTDKVSDHLLVDLCPVDTHSSSARAVRRQKTQPRTRRLLPCNVLYA